MAAVTEPGSSKLNATQSAYKVNPRFVVVPLGSGFTQIVTADPMRWYLEFRSPTGAVTLPLILPFPVPAGVPTGNACTIPGPYMFTDCPGLTTGSWWIDSTLAPSLIVIEERYVGK